MQRIRANVKRYSDGWGEYHPLTGLLYCADCGGKLYVHRTSNGRNIPKYACGNYTKTLVGSRCKSAHCIDAATVMELVSETLKGIVSYAREDRAAFTKAVQETLSTQQVNEVKAQRKRLAVCQKRAADLETLIQRIYEDNANGKLSESRFQMLSDDYEQEQEELREKLL